MTAFIAAITSVVGWPRRHESAGMPTRPGCLHPRGRDPATPRPRWSGARASAKPPWSSTPGGRTNCPGSSRCRPRTPAKP